MNFRHYAACAHRSAGPRRPILFWLRASNIPGTQQAEIISAPTPPSDGHTVNLYGDGGPYATTPYYLTPTALK
jgi:hypothetical protein